MAHCVVTCPQPLSVMWRTGHFSPPSASLDCSLVSAVLWWNSQICFSGCGCGQTRRVCVFFVEPIVLSPLLCCTAVCSKTCTNGRGTRCASLCETAEVSLGQSWQRARVCVHPVMSDTQGRGLSSFLLHETIWATWLSSVCVPRTSYKAFVSFPVFLPS